MLFASEREKRLFFEDLYQLGLKVAKKRYYCSPQTENVWSHEDIVSESILYINKKLQEKNFSCLGQLKAWFFLNLRQQARVFRKRYGSALSLNQEIGESATTLEQFIASRTVHPSLESVENKGKVAAALNSLPKDQKQIFQYFWIDGMNIQEICHAIPGANPKYVERSLKAAKLKLGRNMIVKSIKS